MIKNYGNGKMIGPAILMIKKLSVFEGFSFYIAKSNYNCKPCPKNWVRLTPGVC